eukprot:768759-Hanusia_phi.AAC.7
MEMRRRRRRRRRRKRRTDSCEDRTPPPPNCTRPALAHQLLSFPLFSALSLPVLPSFFPAHLNVASSHRVHHLLTGRQRQVVSLEGRSAFHSFPPSPAHARVQAVDGVEVSPPLVVSSHHVEGAAADRSAASEARFEHVLSEETDDKCVLGTWRGSQRKRTLGSA